MLLILLFRFCFGSLFIYSPDELKGPISNLTIFGFGNPSFYDTVGKLVFLDLTSCSVTSPLDTYSIAVITLPSNSSCLYSEIVLSVQNNGGIGSIIVVSPNDHDQSFIPSTELLDEEISILALAIGSELGEKLQKYSNEEIWVSYNYDVSIKEEPVITYYLTSDIHTDEKFFSKLQDLNDRISLSPDKFRIGFSYVMPSDPRVDKSKDCLDSTIFCLPPNAVATGSQRLESAVISLNYFSSLKDSEAVSKIISYFQFLDRFCSADYSHTCHQLLISSHGGSSNTSREVLDYVPVLTGDYFFIIFTIGLNTFYWEQFLEEEYCFSSTLPYSGCPKCSDECPFTDLSETECIAVCNTSACGYGNMKCLESNECFTFMLGDGNCNSQCTNDPDCTLDSSRSLFILVLFVVIVGAA